MVYLPWTGTGLSTESSTHFCNCGERFGCFISIMFVFTDNKEKIWLEEAKQITLASKLMYLLGTCSQKEQPG